MMLLQFTLAACLHKTLLIHVDRLFDVGLCLIEQLARQTHLRAWSVCVRVCVDAEQIKTMLPVPVLIITPTVGVCLQQPGLCLPVFLQTHTHTCAEAG